MQQQIEELTKEIRDCKNMISNLNWKIDNPKGYKLTIYNDYNIYFVPCIDRKIKVEYLSPDSSKIISLNIINSISRDIVEIKNEQFDSFGNLSFDMITSNNNKEVEVFEISIHLYHYNTPRAKVKLKLSMDRSGNLPTITFNGDMAVIA